jgi:16S rRNA processing protein RimM
MEDWIKLGFIRSAFGIKGGVKYALFNEESTAIRVGTNLKLIFSNGEEKLLEVLEVVDGFRVYFAGIEDRNEAFKLASAELFIHRNDLPALSEDEFYLNDAIGAKVFDLNNKQIGTVASFSSNGTQTLMEIKTNSGHLASIPVVKPLVEKIDIDGNKIIIDPPDGLLQL